MSAYHWVLSSLLGKLVRTVTSLITQNNLPVFNASVLKKMNQAKRNMGELNMRDDYLKDLEEKFDNVQFKRLLKIEGLYITNFLNKNTANDSRIFQETHVKRILRTLYSRCASKEIQNKLNYFSQNEDENNDVMYHYDECKEMQLQNYAVQNIGHATQLIQIPNFNILTDPTFDDLNKILYPCKTKSSPAIEELPKIDVIVISHNHRDHLEENMLQMLLANHEKNNWEQPHVFVPVGDKEVIKNFGFHSVEEVEWYSKITVNKKFEDKNMLVDFISIPADHRSGRFIFDHHKSLVTGWVINPENENVIFKFSGDTRSLSDENQMAVDAVLWNEISQKKSYLKNFDFPDIICFEPSGPNYTRSDMDVTHQSTSYSILLKFIEANNLSLLSGVEMKNIIIKIHTILMHHNKYELGPDRFNEGLFIFKKLYEYLKLNKEELDKELIRQEEKLHKNLDYEKLKQVFPFIARPVIKTLPSQTSILVHSKEFIIKDILNTVTKGVEKELVKEFILSNTLFPKIGECLNRDKILNSNFDINSIKKYTGKCRS